MLNFVIEKIKEFEHKITGNEIILKDCLFCGNSNYKLYVNKDTGLYHCKVCSESGNYAGLKKEFMVEEVKNKEIDYNKYHEKLMAGGDVLDYLVVDRKLSEETLRHFKIGASDERVVIPFIVNDRAIYWKTRLIREPHEGETKYKNATGSVRLFNEAVLKDKSITELFIVEGEIDAMSLWQMGFKNVVAVPGAGTKKAEWIKLLDESSVKKVYLIYDNDKAGQTGAQKLAERIGIQKCWNVILPDSRDINDILQTEDQPYSFITKYLQHATQFKLEGVQDCEEVLDDLLNEFLTKGPQPSYVPDWWPSLASKMGGYEDGDLIGLLGEAKSGKTTQSLNWLYYHVKRYKQPGCMMCYEMMPKRMMRKLVSFITQTDDTPGKNEMSPEVVVATKKIIAEEGIGKDDLIFVRNTGDVEHVFDKIRSIVRIYGIKFLVFDNLHLLARNLNNATQELNILSKKFKEIATELGIVILLILQPHRLQEGKTVSARNVGGSSAPEKDCDTLICINRVRKMGNLTQDDLLNAGIIDTEETFEPEMFVNIDLSRYSGGGKCTLYIDGARSTVKELNQNIIESINPPVESV